MKPTYSIAVTTFVYRLDKYYKPLMNAISRMRPDIDKLVFVNGQHKRKFDQEYRKEIMRFSSLCPRTYLVMSPIVRGCSFMWNTLCNYTDTDYILVLNDDLVIQDGFFDALESALDQCAVGGGGSFRINNSFSHFCIDRQDLFNVGFFDERLIGFGEEDGDWMWRHEVALGRPMRSLMTPTVINCVDNAETNSENMQKSSGKYTAFNSRWIFNHKYNDKATAIDPSQPKAFANYGRPIQMYVGASTPDFYPAEKWYRDNIDKV